MLLEIHLKRFVGINCHISLSLEPFLQSRLSNVFKGEADRLWGHAIWSRGRHLWRISPGWHKTHASLFVTGLWDWVKWDKVQMLIHSWPPLVDPTWLTLKSVVRKSRRTMTQRSTTWWWWVMLLATQPHVYVRHTNDKVQQPGLMRIWFGCQGHIWLLPMLKTCCSLTWSDLPTDVPFEPFGTFWKSLATTIATFWEPGSVSFVTCEASVLLHHFVL